MVLAEISRNKEAEKVNYSKRIKLKHPQLLIESLLLLYSFADENIHPLDEPATAESEASSASVSLGPILPSFVECILSSGLFFHSVILR